ncbi:hypothetical protein RJ639_027330 [Escallonia herrerae]|uniref:Protein YIP n=1 Tax=Escallonia herrerae TaxID=1293975 RepID=A0AA89BE12_9ASTE|nr:hypothetical protein RJ639_027330 [Escallonia herrerae]
MKNLPLSLPQDWKKWGETSIFFTEEQGVIHVFALNLIDASTYHVVDYLFPDPQLEGRIGRVALGSRIYFFGGNLIETAADELTYPLTMCVYDLRNRTWRDGPDLLGPKPCPLVVVIEAPFGPGDDVERRTLSVALNFTAGTIVRDGCSRAFSLATLHCRVVMSLLFVYKWGEKDGDEDDGLAAGRGGHIIFFQSLSLLGYCLFPLDVGAVICMLKDNVIVKVVVVCVTLAWSSWAAYPFMSTAVNPRRKALALYPVLLMYVSVGFLIIAID